MVDFFLKQCVKVMKNPVSMSSEVRGVVIAIPSLIY